MAFIEVGKVLGRLTVTTKISAYKAICKCECGSENIFTLHKLKYGGAKCCGCTHTGLLGVKKTNEQAIRLSKELHGELYGYDRFVYIHGKSPVELFCKSCDEYFSVEASHHLSRKRKVGCQKCSVKRRANFHRSTKEEFINKSISAHFPKGRTFDYSKVEYVNARTKVEIGCNTCGNWFWQTPYIHSTGKGCVKCRDAEMAKARSHTKEIFEQEALKITGKKYSYHLVEYKNARTPVKIVCNDCGEIFQKKPTEILAGLGCRCHAQACGYKANLDGKLYVLSCGNVTKIGITNLDPEDRAKTVSKSYGSAFSVISEYKMDGQLCTDLETIILSEMRKVYKNPTFKFDGYTESFYDVDREKLHARIEELIKDKNG